jgi:hypothetical protein
MMIELVLCIGSDRHRKIKPTQLSTLRTFCGTKDTCPKSNLAKEKKIALPKSENALGPVEMDLGYCGSSGKGVEP